jgi:hypothetical protein
MHLQAQRDKRPLMKLYHGTTNRAANCIEKEGFRGSELSEFTSAGTFVEDGVVFAARTIEEAAEYGEAIFEIDVPAEFINEYADGWTSHCYITISDMIEQADWSLLS